MVFFQRTSGCVVFEIARLKHGTSSRPSSMSSLPNILPGGGSFSSIENIAVNIPLGKFSERSLVFACSETRKYVVLRPNFKK